MDNELALQVALLGLAMHGANDDELTTVQKHFSDEEINKISSKFLKIIESVDNRMLLNYIASEIRRLDGVLKDVAS